MSTQPAPSTERRIVWRPQAGPQKALIDCPLSEIFFGGARGGGKTDGVLGKWSFDANGDTTLSDVQGFVAKDGKFVIDNVFSSGKWEK